MAVVAAERPRISVLVPTLNEAGCIEQTLACLQPMRARGHELIVIDGGSTDATVALSEPYTDRIMHTDSGRSRQMYDGASHAGGDIFWFLHADTLVPVNADRLIIKALAKKGRCWGRFDVELAGSHPVFRCIAWSMNLRSRVTGIVTGDQGIFMTRAAYEQIGGFPPIPLMEDIAASRALRRLARPVTLRTVLRTSARRWYRQGVCRTVLTMWCLRLAFFVGISPQRLARYY